MIKIFFIILFLFLFNYSISAQIYGDVTGYKIPRFVSLKSDDVNLRIGSSTIFPIILKYNSLNLPVEIIEEFENWRKIKDIQSNIGWVHKNLLKGERFAVINLISPNIVANVYSRPEGKLTGKIGNYNIVKILSCLLDWCNISIKNNKGWIRKKNIWGIYKKENININYYQLAQIQLWKIIDLLK